jgi:hypothetical protein
LPQNLPLAESRLKRQQRLLNKKKREPKELAFL